MYKNYSKKSAPLLKSKDQQNLDKKWVIDIFNRLCQIKSIFLQNNEKKIKIVQTCLEVIFTSLKSMRMQSESTIGEREHTLYKNHISTLYKKVNLGGFSLSKAEKDEILQILDYIELKYQELVKFIHEFQEKNELKREIIFHTHE